MNYTKKILFNLSFLISLSAYMFTSSISASSFRKEGFHYYKKVKAENKIDFKKNIYGRIILDKEINKYSYGPDIVISYKNESLPSFVQKMILPEKEKGSSKVKVLYKQKYKNGTVSYTIKLAEIPASMQYDGISFKSASSYEMGVQVYVGSSPEHWLRLGKRFLYAYSNRKRSKNSIKFIAANKRFLRLVFDKNINIKFLKASYSDKRRAKEIKTSINENNFSYSLNNDTKSSVYFFANEDRRKINRLILGFKEKRYNRKMIIMQQFSRNGNFKKLQRLKLISNIEGMKQIIEFPKPSPTALKIIIYNLDDKALTLKKLEAFSPVEELIFKLPQDYKLGSKFSLYYGNKYRQSKNYELEKIFKKYSLTKNITTFKALKHQTNKDFSYSLLEPPLSIWLIRVLFYLGLIAFAIPALKTYRYLYR